MDPQELAQKVVDTMLARDTFSRWLGIEVISVAPHQAVVKMRVRSDMLNGFGVCHGGIQFSLADSAFAFAANTQGRVSLSIENNIAYPIAVYEGDQLTASACESSPGNKIATYDVNVTNQKGEKVALFRGTVFRTSKELLDA